MTGVWVKAVARSGIHALAEHGDARTLAVDYGVPLIVAQTLPGTRMVQTTAVYSRTGYDEAVRLCRRVLPDRKQASLRQRSHGLDIPNDASKQIGNY